METQGMDPGHCQGWAIQKQANEAQGHLIDIMGRLLSAPGLLHREGGGVFGEEVDVRLYQQMRPKKAD